MIGLDTNVLVRYIVQDDPAQAASATELIETTCSSKSPGRVDPVVLCELVWVLERGYRYDRATVASVIRRILVVEELYVPEVDLAWRALRRYERGRAGFADYLIGIRNRVAGATVTYTFDKKAAESDLFLLVPTRSPEQEPA